MRSPQLQGAALETPQAFFAALAAHSASAPPPPPALSDKAILAALLEAGGGSKRAGVPVGRQGVRPNRVLPCVWRPCAAPPAGGEAAVVATAGVLLE